MSTEQEPLSVVVKREGDFTLDTSGWVWLQCGRLANTYWEDLTPFQQGYVDALFASMDRGTFDVPVLRQPENSPCTVVVGFSDLSPEALALILKDCEEGHPIFQRTAAGGKRFWITRQLNGLADFPPLTAYLSDDGKVHLRGRV